MTVQPTSQIFLLSGIPIDGYRQQRTFKNETEQHGYFLSHQAGFIPGNGEMRYSYIRPGVISVPYPKDDLWNICYLMYQNEKFLAKWFYAFVTRLEYVNSATTNIYFEVDEYQTWMFDITFHPSYVLREHPATDSVGSNLIDEGLSIGEYVTQTEINIKLNDCWICVVSTVDLASNSFEAVGGQTVNGVYTGAAIYTFSDVSSLNNIIQDLAEAGKSDAIVGMYMLPKIFTASIQQNADPLRPNEYGSIQQPVSLPPHLNGYTPKNAKTLTYPYRAIMIAATGGTANVVKCEYFSGTVPTFLLVASLANSGSIIMFPMNYKGVNHNVLEGVTTGSYLQCQWAKDNYLNFLAVQDIKANYAGNQIGIDYNRGAAVIQAAYSGTTEANQARGVGGAIEGAIRGGVQGGASMASKGPWAAAGGAAVGAVTGAVGASAINYGVNQTLAGITAEQAESINAINYNFSFDSLRNALAEERDVHQLIPPSANGVMGSSPLMAANEYKFTIQVKSVKYEYAQAIDDFFSMYGYKTNKMKVPEMSSRPFWNYVRTNDCNISGCIPKDSRDIIRAMFNNGVTLWHTDNMLDYSQDNSVFKPPSEGVTLTVKNGSGSGVYNPGSVVPIQADEVQGKTFKNWMIDAGQPEIADFYSPSTTCTVNGDATISVFYDTPLPGTYGLTVVNGTGSGQYAPGTMVTATATVPAGRTFVKWTATGLAQPEFTINPISFAMPANNASLTAVFDEPTPPEYFTMADVMEPLIGSLEWDSTIGAIQQWYYGFYSKTAWCATSLSWAAMKAGVQSQCPKNENATTFMMQCNPRSRFWYTANYGGTNKMPERGDCIGFTPNGNKGNIRHVGVVSRVEGNTIYYISGNTTNPVKGQPDGIFEKSQNINNSYVCCFFHVIYDKEIHG